MTHNKTLPPSFKIKILKKRFEKLNPDIDSEAIDWEATVGKAERFAESEEDFKRDYPQFRWDNLNNDPYYFHAVKDLRERAGEYGFDLVDSKEQTRLVNKADKLGHENASLKLDLVKSKQRKFKGISLEPFERIREDIRSTHIIVLSENGHGKSTSLMTLIKYIREKEPETIFKVFDVSQAWFHRSPLDVRVRVLNLQRVRVPNLDNCVYAIGALGEDARRMVVAGIIGADYTKRYIKAIEGDLNAAANPRMIYIFEEAETYLGSYVLRRRAPWIQPLKDFVNVGRNYGLRAFAVVSAEKGELSPGFRRRVGGRLLGQVLNEYDLSNLRRKSKRLPDLVKKLPRFHWIYYNGMTTEPFRIADEVDTVPADYVKPAPPKKRGFWSKFFSRGP